jgi:hypothetical protein
MSLPHNLLRLHTHSYCLQFEPALVTSSRSASDTRPAIKVSKPSMIPSLKPALITIHDSGRGSDTCRRAQVHARLLCGMYSLLACSYRTLTQPIRSLSIRMPVTLPQRYALSYSPTYLTHVVTFFQLEDTVSQECGTWPIPEKAAVKLPGMVHFPFAYFVA